MTIDDIHKIKYQLQRMREADPDFRVFGAKRHRYLLGTPLTENELQTVEEDHQVTLPADYRLFLKEVGNGGSTRSSARVIAVNAGAGPGYGLMPLDEAVQHCDLRQPFPLTESTRTRPIAAIERWGEEEPYPGVLEIAYHGCANFTYLVVHGPAYGTVWEAEVDLRIFDPAGLSFEAWYQRWIDRLIERAIPILANERVVQHVNVGMTKSQVLGIVGGPWQQSKFGEKHSFLRFERLATQFVLDENDVIVRIVHHDIH